MKKIKVLIADDHAVVRMGLKYALSLFKDISLTGEIFSLGCLHRGVRI